MKKPSERWRLPDKERAYKILRWKPIIVLICIATIAILSHVLPYWYRVTEERAHQAEVIMSIIEEANPSYDPVFAEATAKYMIKYSKNIDPILVACVWRWESSFIKDSESHVGASGYGGNLPTAKERKKYSRAEWLSLELQLIQTVDDLNDKYESGYCVPKTDKKGRIIRSKNGNALPVCGIGKKTVYAMHRGYVGAVENKATADNYITKIYTLYIDKTGVIWRGKKGCDGNGKLKKIDIKEDKK